MIHVHRYFTIALSTHIISHFLYSYQVVSPMLPTLVSLPWCRIAYSVQTTFSLIKTTTSSHSNISSKFLLCFLWPQGEKKLWSVLIPWKPDTCKNLQITLKENNWISPITLVLDLQHRKKLPLTENKKHSEASKLKVESTKSPIPQPKTSQIRTTKMNQRSPTVLHWDS